MLPTPTIQMSPLSMTPNVTVIVFLKLPFWKEGRRKEKRREEKRGRGSERSQRRKEKGVHWKGVHTGHTVHTVTYSTVL